MLRPLRLIVLISGNGSNLQAIIDAIQNQILNAEICCVISNNPNAYGLTRATIAGIKTAVLETKNFHSRTEYDLALAELIQQESVDLIVLAGFMRILSPQFVTQFQSKIINIHPSLLPKYPGLDTHKKVLLNHDAVHGCTIHYVTEDLDAGPIIASKSLNVLANDTEESLKQRVQVLEHELYIEVLHRFSTGQLKIPKNLR